MQRWGLTKLDLAVTGLFLTTVMLYSLLIPFNEAPDEITHFFLVEYLYAFGDVARPRIDPVEPFFGGLSGFSFASDQFWYYGLPYLHALGAWVVSEIVAPWLPVSVRFLAPRAFNWLLAIPFALSVLALARIGGASRLKATLAAMIVLFIPQVVFVFSYYNSDAFGLTAVALTTLAFERLLARRSLVCMGIFGLGCGLVLLTKLYFFPALVFYACVFAYKLAAGQVSFRLLHILVFFAATSLSAVPMLISAYVHFGEVTGVGGQLYFRELHRNNPNVQWGTCYLVCGDALVRADTLGLWFYLAYRSFFAVFGYMSIYLPEPFYRYVFAAITGAILLASAVRTVQSFIVDGRLVGALASHAVHIILFWLMLAGTILLSIAASQLTLPQPQGRYLFVVIPFLPLILGLLISPAWSRTERSVAA